MMCTEATETTETAAEGGQNERLVIPRNHYELIDDLATMLGISSDESAEVRYCDELYKRKVLKAAIRELNSAWNAV